MIAEQTKDYDFIRGIITHPGVWPRVVDDGVPPPQLFQPNRDMLYVAVSDPVPLALYVFHPLNATTAMVHVCALPPGLGRTTQTTLTAFRWVFANSAWFKIIGFVPSFNRLTLALADRVGMMREGVVTASFLKDGVLYDQVIVGIERKALCQ